MTTKDPVDIDYDAHEASCARTPEADYIAAANKYDSERKDIPSAEEQDRMIAAYNRQVLSEFSAWCARPVHSPERQRLLDAAKAQIQRQYGKKTA